MYKKIFTLSFTFLLSLSIFAQEVPEVQKTILTKVTATWCPNCGSWGWDFFEHLIDDNSEKAVFIGAHHSGDLGSSVGTALSDNFNAPYQPYFYAGNTDLGVTNGNVTAKRQEAKELVDANALLAPVANVGLDATLDGGFLSVDLKSKFFQEATGNFYLGVYLLEDEVINNQASNSSMAIHPFVMRTSLTGTDFGDPLSNGTIAANSEFENTVSIQLNPNWNKDNLSVIGIIWEKKLNDDDEEFYDFINVNSTDEFSTPTAVQSITSDVLKVDLYPTIAKESARLDLNLKTRDLHISIQVFNQKGQLVSSLFEGNINEGSKSLEIETSNLTAGVYFVNIRSIEGAVITRKLIVQ